MWLFKLKFQNGHSYSKRDNITRYIQVYYQYIYRSRCISVYILDMIVRARSRPPQGGGLELGLKVVYIYTYVRGSD